MSNISCLIRTKNHEKLIKQLYGDDLTEEQLAAYFVRHEAVADMVATIMSKRDITGSAIVSLPTVISILDGSYSLDEIAQENPERAEAFKKAFIERYRYAMNAAGNEEFFSSMPIKQEGNIISFFPDVAVNIEDYGSIETAKQALRIYTGAAIQFGTKNIRPLLLIYPYLTNLDVYADFGNNVIGHANTSTGRVGINNIGLTREKFLLHLQGKTKEQYADQKAAVMQRLINNGWTLEAIEALIETDVDAFNVMLGHEASHILHKDQYAKKDYMSEAALAIETRATEDALNQLKAWKSANPEKPTLGEETQAERITAQNSAAQNKAREEAAKKAGNNTPIINNYRTTINETSIQEQSQNVEKTLAPQEIADFTNYVTTCFRKSIDKKLRIAQQDLVKIAAQQGKDIDVVRREQTLLNKELLKKINYELSFANPNMEAVAKWRNQVIPLTEKDVVNKKGAITIFTEIKNVLAEQAEEQEGKTKETIQNVINNFDVFSRYAANRINNIYGLNVFSSLDEVSLDEDSEDGIDDVENHNSDNEEKSVKEDFSRSGDHSKSSELSLAHTVRQLYGEIYQIGRDGNFLRDAIGQKMPMDISIAHGIIGNQLRFMIDARDMIPLLRRMSQPWVQQVIDKLVDENDNIKDQQLFNAFYSSYKLYQQPFTVMIKVKQPDGTTTYQTKIVGSVESAKYVVDTTRKNISTGTRLSDDVHSLYDSTGNVNKTDFIKGRSKEIEQLRDSLVRLKGRRAFDNIDSLISQFEKDNNISLNATVSADLQNLGIEIPKDFDLATIIKASTISAVESTEANFNNLVTLLNSISHIYKQSVNLGENKDIVNNSSKDYRTIANILSSSISDVTEASTVENGKQIYSLGKPNYFSNLVQKIKQTVFGKEDDNKQNYYSQWIEQTFGKFDFFRNQDTGKWRSDWLSKLFGSDRRYREMFEHTNVLTFDKTDYSDWKDRECWNALYNMYTALPFNASNGNEQTAWYRMPLYSDSPAADFVKFVKYVTVGNVTYEDILVDKFYDLCKQERSRMRAVKERTERRMNGEKLNELSGFDAKFNKEGNLTTAGGLVFRFMPRLNYLKVDDSFGYPQLVGMSFNEGLEWLVRNANSLGLTDADCKQFFKTAFLQVFEDDFERNFRELWNTGKLETAKNGFCVDIHDSKGQPVKLFSNSTTAFLQNAPLIIDKMSEKHKHFTDDTLNRLNHKQFVSEMQLEMAVEIYNQYVQPNQKINYQKSPAYEAIREYEMNFQFATSQMIQLTTTDLAFYGKVECEPATKANYDFAYTHTDVDGKETTSYYKVTSDDTIKTFQKRFKEVHAPSSKGNSQIGAYARKNERTVILNDMEIKSVIFDNVKKVIMNNPNLKETDKKAILKAFSKVNVADAQAYRSIESYGTIMGQMGMLTPEMQRTLNRIKQGKFSMADIDVVFQTLKPYVYTRVTTDSHVRTRNGKDYLISTPVQHKNSEYALITAGVIAASLQNNPLLAGLHQFMKENDIDVVQFESTTKVGLQGALKQEWFANGANANAVSTALKTLCGFDSNPNGNPEIVHEIPMEDWGIQTATPEHIIDKVQLFGTQIRKLMLSDMPANAQFRVGNKMMSKDELIKHYNNLITENIIESFMEINEIFSDPEQIEQIVRESVSTSNKYDQDLIDACTWNKETQSFNIPFSDRVITEKVQQLLNSIVKSRVTKQKIKGGACIQVSNYGLTEELQIRFRDSEGNKLQTKQEFGKEKSLTEATLDVEYDKYLQEHQASIECFECYMPCYSQELVEALIDENGIINVNDLPEDLRKAIGYRVPTEDMYSMAPLYIKGFLPQNNGSAIMLPSDITTIAGSDFDVDKMYIMLPEFTVVKYDEKKAADDFAKVESTEKFVSSLLGQFKSVEQIELPEITNFKRWFNIHQDDVDDNGQFKYKLPRNKWKIIPYKYNFDKSVGSQNVKKRNNGLIQLMYSVLQAPYSAEKILNPGGFEPQKIASRICSIIDNTSTERLLEITDAKNLKEAVAKLQQMSLDDLDALDNNAAKTTNPLSAETAVKLHQQNMTGASQVGIFANYNVLHTLLQYCDVSVNEDFQPTINGNRSVTKGFKFGSVKNGKGKLISKLTAGYLAASVDNGKDPLLKGLNSTPETANMVAYLSLLGFEPLEIGAFLSNPIVVKFFNVYDINTNNNEEQIILDLQRSLGFDQFSEDYLNELQTAYHSLSLEDMLLAKAYGKKQSDGETLSASEQKLFDGVSLNILEQLTKIRKGSQELSNLLNTSRADTQGGAAGPTMIKNINFERKLKTLDLDVQNTALAIVKSPVSNPTDEFVNMSRSELRERYSNNPLGFMQAFSELGVLSMKSLLGQYFMEYNPKVQMLLERLTNPFGNIPEKTAKKLLDAVQQYAMSETALFGKEDDITTQKKRAYYQKQFPKEFTEWKSKLPENIAQMSFIQKMNVVTGDKKTETFPHIELRDLGKTKTIRDTIKREWEILYDYDADMATKLFVYGALRGGFGFNPKSYLHLAPVSIRQKMNGYVETVAGLQDGSIDFDAESLWFQFCRNNWKNNAVVKQYEKLPKGYSQSDKIIIGSKKVYAQTVRDSERELKEFPICIAVADKDNPDNKKLYQRKALAYNSIDKTIVGNVIYEEVSPLGLGNLWQEYDANDVMLESIFDKNMQNDAESDGDNAAPETGVTTESAAAVTATSNPTVGKTNNDTDRNNNKLC